MSITKASLLADSFGSTATGVIPIGGIIMWSGSIAAIPTGWTLCNGVNGTPNLADRFIVGAGSGYAVATTGGSADATLPSHSHTATSTSSVSDPGHTHTLFASNTSDGGNGSAYRWESNNSTRNSTVSGAAIGEASTGISVSTLTSITAQGSSATNANLPPYYALAFIMRVS